MEHNSISGELALVGVELVLARSDFLDAFSDLEEAVAKVLRSTGQTPTSEPFSQRVKAFRTAEKTTLVAKQNHTKRDQIADEICALLRLRADIVHSRMHLLTIDGEVHASFVNVHDVGTLHPARRILNLDDFKELGRMALQLVKRISQLNCVNPPSSQPRPSPGAASVP